MLRVEGGRMRGRRVEGEARDLRGRCTKVQMTKPKCRRTKCFNASWALVRGASGRNFLGTVAHTFFSKGFWKKVIKKSREVESTFFLAKKRKFSIALLNRREKSPGHNNHGVRSMRENGTLRRSRCVLYYLSPDGPPGAAGPAQTRYRS